MSQPTPPQGKATQPPTRTPAVKGADLLQPLRDPTPADADPKLGAHVVPHPLQHEAAKDVVQHGAPPPKEGESLRDDRQTPLDDATGATVVEPTPGVVEGDEHKLTDKELYPKLDIVQKSSGPEGAPYVEQAGGLLRVGGEYVKPGSIQRMTDVEGGLKVVTSAGEIVVPKEHVKAFHDALGTRD